MSDNQKIQQTKDVIRYAKKYISGRTLDLGAGSAKYASIIKERASGYVTFDLVPGKNIDVVGDIMNTTFDSASLDTVICTQVLEHVEKPWLVIKEIGRLLKKGGVCILTAPFLIAYHADPHDYFRFTKEGLESLFKNENFEIVECDGYGRVFSVLSENIKFLWFNPYGRKIRGLWRIMRFIERSAGFLDKFSKNKIIYNNVYIVARKK